MKKWIEVPSTGGSNYKWLFSSFFTALYLENGVRQSLGHN